MFISSSHPERELLIPLRGTCDYMFNHSVYTASPGTVFLIDHWVNHALGYRSCDKDLLHLWLYIKGAAMWANVMIVEFDGKHRLYTHSLDLPQEYNTILSRRWDMFECSDNHSEREAAFLMKSVLNAVMDEFALLLETQDAQYDQEMRRIVEAMKKYIRSSNGRNCSMEQLEKYFGYNRFYLAHQFKKLTQETLGGYLQSVRIDYVVAALNRGMKQKEIAYELGFSSPANFWKWLQKHKGDVEWKRWLQ